MNGWIFWSGTLLVFFGIGALTGFLLDIVVWQISYDYVYAPNFFLRNGIRFGFIIGAIVAFIGTFFELDRVTLNQWSFSVLILLICTLAGGAILGILFGVLAKSGFIYSDTQTVIPLSRLYFCDGLSKGTIWGGAVGAIMFLRFIAKASRKNSCH